MTEITVDVAEPAEIYVTPVTAVIDVTAGVTTEITVTPPENITIDSGSLASPEITVTPPGDIGLTVMPPPAVTFKLGSDAGVTDHGALTGLDDDDHPQYLKPSEVLPGTNVTVDTVTTPGAVIISAAGGGDGGVSDHGDLTGLTDDDHPQYAKVDGTRAFTGTVTVPDLKISQGADPGLVWTADDNLGGGSWQEPSSLVVAETSDPVLINWFDLSNEGWAQFSGAGTMTWVEMPSPSMPGVLDCNGDVWAEWTFGSPMVFEPGALYRVTVRARMDTAGALSFGFQGYDAGSPAVVVDAANGFSAINPHFVAVDMLPGDAAWIDDVVAPGEWLAWTGYLSGKASGAAENIPPADSVAPAETAVIVAANVSQWRPVFHSQGRVWVDAIEVHRLDRSLELPGGIRASDVYAGSVNANSVTTTDLIMPPSTTGYVLTAVDPDGGSEWQYPPITATEGLPSAAPENPLTINMGTVASRQGCGVLVCAVTTTITSITPTTRIPGSKAIQFELVSPAMVTCRGTMFLNTLAASSSIIYASIGVSQDGTLIYSDDWSASSGSAYAGSAYFRCQATANNLSGSACLWKQYLQPGTYTVFPAGWLSSADAASEKKIGMFTIEIEIDPEMTYLTGQRS